MFFDFFFDKILEEKQSKFNGNVRVIQYQGKIRLIADNLMQSGDWIEKMWQKPLRYIVEKKPTFSPHVNTILLLGLGGGTMLGILEKQWPQAVIKAVEIDPIMVELAKKYFNLDRHKAEVIVDNAFVWVEKQEGKQKFDLIIVDLFCGHETHPQIVSFSFLKACSRILNSHGVLLTNLLFYGKYQARAEEFIKESDKIFSSIELVRQRWNLFALASV